MVTNALVNDFLAQKNLVLVGLSRSEHKYGNAIYKTLTENGFKVFPIHKSEKTIRNIQCYPNLTSIPDRVEGIVICVPPEETLNVVREAASAGINRVWMQQGAESDSAIQFCKQNNISAVYGHCILMFAEPVSSLHRFHRWIWKLIGKIPK